MILKDYIIDNIIRFSPERQIVCLRENPDSFVVLTPASNRLLLYLICNQGEIISRERIFSALWEQYGNTPSNSSLNSYISLIRKCFNNLGVSVEVITTIPKTGFLFNPELQVDVEIIELEQSSSINDITTNECEELTKISVAGCSEFSEKNVGSEAGTEVDIKNIVRGVNYKLPVLKYKSNKYPIFMFMVLLILVALLWGYCQESKGYLHVTPVNIGVFDKCSIMFLPIHESDVFSLSAQDAISIIKSSKIKCYSGGVYYIQTNKIPSLSEKGRLFLSYCEVGSYSVMNCTNFLNENTDRGGVISK
ncbi:winged helix-turn-helix domain-containing protein (plasmid) [Klebsiella pasteurii]|uniref:winged helix-turn-helix domain-containing protein n=1 Tax=Klebsiella pasteurii TaxID=2587529 RepID=UPI002543DC8E|nr:winged helix-turn-helix domain-containing protein [Klebsiella pasteurii]WII85134.1 winged helix-turn-helix domain-containing protein [Klebsiella pasteurii]